MAVLSISITACTTKTQKSDNDSSSTSIDTNSSSVSTGSENNPDKEVSTCYTYDKNKNLINIHLNVSNGKVTGDLNYTIFEKDKNKGSINGEMRGDTLLADYTFMSEGMESVRQVAFLKKGNSLVEGTADVEEKNGKVVFKDLSSLKFDDIVLTPVDCKE